MEWIKVEDRLPIESDNIILAISKNGFKELIWIDKDLETRKPFAYDKHDSPVINYEDIVYWMPLPDPPKK